MQRTNYPAGWHATDMSSVQCECDSLCGEQVVHSSGGRVLPDLRREAWKCHISTAGAVSSDSGTGRDCNCHWNVFRIISFDDNECAAGHCYSFSQLFDRELTQWTVLWMIVIPPSPTIYSQQLSSSFRLARSFLPNCFTVVWICSRREQFVVVRSSACSATSREVLFWLWWAASSSSSRLSRTESQAWKYS